MLKRELKINFKSFIIWISILIGLFLFVYLLYPSIISNGNLGQIDEMMKLFPEEVLKSFNLDIAIMDSAFGWIKSEGWIFVLLLMGVYSSLLGGTILLKEESDKTIEYLGCLPVSRKQIVLSKTLCGYIYIFIMNIIFFIFNLIALKLSGDFDIKVFILLSITPLLSSTVLYSLSLFISTFMRKTKKITAICLGITFASYLLNIFSTISTQVDFLKYLSVFTLCDIRNVILNEKINILMLIITIILNLVFVKLSEYKYQRKEFV